MQTPHGQVLSSDENVLLRGQRQQEGETLLLVQIHFRTAIMNYSCFMLIVDLLQQQTNDKIEYYTSAVSLLVKVGAKVRDNAWFSPVAKGDEASALQMAIEIGSLELTELLVSAGADVNRGQPVYAALVELAKSSSQARNEWKALYSQR